MTEINTIVFCLKRLFDIPSLVLIVGKWKVGKTDFALLIGELLLKLNLIDKMASNIETIDPRVTFISDLVNIKRWLHADRSTKLYILDEANTHLIRRRAMSRKNVEAIAILPEISKAHGRIIVIGHDEKNMDSAFTSSVYLRGIFEKHTQKSVSLISDRLTDNYDFYNLPRTTIKFDPYLIAPFTIKPKADQVFDNVDHQLLHRWVNGESNKELGFDHQMKFKRWMKKTVRALLLQLSPVT